MKLKGCYIFFHKYEFTNESQTERRCKKCGKMEFLDLENDVNPYSNPIWVKKN